MANSVGSTTIRIITIIHINNNLINMIETTEIDRKKKLNYSSLNKTIFSYYTIY